MKIAKETWILAVIGIADLATTIVWIGHNGAQEANPLFRLFWQQGMPVFVVAKALFLLGPLMVLECARKQHARFVLLASRTAIVAYLALYGVGVVQLNTNAFREMRRPGPQTNYTQGPLRPTVM